MVMDGNGRSHRPKGLPQGLAGTYDASRTMGDDTDLTGGESLPPRLRLTPDWRRADTEPGMRSDCVYGYSASDTAAWTRGDERLEYEHSVGYDKDLGDFDTIRLTMHTGDGLTVILDEMDGNAYDQPDREPLDADVLERAAVRVREWREETNRNRDPRTQGEIGTVKARISGDGHVYAQPDITMPSRPWNPLLWRQWDEQRRSMDRMIRLD